MSRTAESFRCDDLPTEGFFLIHIVIVLLADFGFTIGHDEFGQFLNSVVFSEEEPNAGSAAAEIPTLSDKDLLSERVPSTTMSHFEGLLERSSETHSDSHHGPGVTLFSKVGRSAAMRTKTLIQHGHFSEGSQASASDTDVASLVTLMSQKDATINRLRLEKRQLQQQLRRLQQKREEEADNHSQTLKQYERKRDFDAHRINDIEHKKLKWSWLTPSGSINVAAPQSNCIVFGYFHFHCWRCLIETTVLVHVPNGPQWSAPASCSYRP